jgi:hypothetical protein
MINDGINDVPEKKIAVFTKEGISYDNVLSILKTPNSKRDWFTPHFYKCLPLSIGNQYGFILSFQYDFDITWDGGSGPESIVINKYIEDNKEECYPNITSIFGSGIATVIVPFLLRTPPGVNLMTINPPNYIIPNITPMTGIVEADNLRQMFTFNLKVQIPNVTIRINKGFPVAAFIPIPRYFVDEFSLINAEEYFTKDIYEEELKADEDHKKIRDESNSKINKDTKYKSDRLYMTGKDIYGNKFKDHQTLKSK